MEDTAMTAPMSETTVPAEHRTSTCTTSVFEGSYPPPNAIREVLKNAHPGHVADDSFVRMMQQVCGGFLSDFMAVLLSSAADNDNNIATDTPPLHITVSKLRATVAVVFPDSIAVPANHEVSRAIANDCTSHGPSSGLAFPTVPPSVFNAFVSARGLGDVALLERGVAAGVTALVQYLTTLLCTATQERQSRRIQGTDLVSAVHASSELSKVFTALELPPSTHFRQDDFHKVLMQVHPDMSADGSARSTIFCYLDNFLRPFFADLFASQTSPSSPPVTVAKLVATVSTHLPGELAKHAISELTKAVTKFGASSPGATGSRMRHLTGPQRAGLQFRFLPAPFFDAFTLPRGVGPARYEHTVTVGFSAMLEYLAAEIWELSGNAARSAGRSMIGADEVIRAIMNDDELKMMFGGENAMLARTHSSCAYEMSGMDDLDGLFPGADGDDE